ncbi:MAG: helix-turn-helix domain-containing protein [Pseudoruegeria sp.]
MIKNDTGEQVVLSIQERRELLGLKKAELSRLAGLNENYVTRLEAGQFTEPSHQKVTSILNVLSEREAVVVNGVVRNDNPQTIQALRAILSADTNAKEVKG